MNCPNPNCNTTGLPEDAKFCPNCGCNIIDVLYQNERQKQQEEEAKVERLRIQEEKAEYLRKREEERQKREEERKKEEEKNRLEKQKANLEIQFQKEVKEVMSQIKPYIPLVEEKTNRGVNFWFRLFNIIIELVIIIGGLIGGIFMFRIGRHTIDALDILLGVLCGLIWSVCGIMLYAKLFWRIVSKRSRQQLMKMDIPMEPKMIFLAVWDYKSGWGLKAFSVLNHHGIITNFESDIESNVKQYIKSLSKYNILFR